MRLQVTLAGLCPALVLLLPAAPARALGRATAWTSVYADDDRLTVVSPAVSATATPHERLDVTAGWDMDAITAASVDVITAASPRGYSEERHGFTLGATWRPATGTSVGLRWLPAFEPDYRSHGLSLSASRELLDARLTARAGYTLYLDRVGRSGDDPSLWRSLTSHATGASLGIVLDRRTVLDVAYELQVADGFQASPYRYVRIWWSGGGDVPVAVPEAVPGLRVRHAAALGLRVAVTRHWFTSTAYRFYLDSWGVKSHTAESELHLALGGDRVILGASLRGYAQSAADFHRERYFAPTGTLPRWRAADKMLATSWTVLAGVRAEVETGPHGPLESLRFTGRVELYETHFLDFEPLARRRAIVASFGASLEL